MVWSFKEKKKEYQDNFRTADGLVNWKNKDAEDVSEKGAYL